MIKRERGITLRGSKMPDKPKALPINLRKSKKRSWHRIKAAEGIGHTNKEALSLFFFACFSFT